MTKKRTTRQAVSSINDRTTDYAERVVAGEELAGPFVRGTCKRHLDDLREGHKRGLFFDVEAAERAYDFFCEVLTVEKDNETVPFIPEPPQAFIIGSLFGWMLNGRRRFQTAYIETGKGSGKSPLAAGIGHYCFVADGVKRAEIYAAATKKDQAMILFRDAVSMVDSSPALSSRITKSGAKPVWQLSHLPSGSFFKPISNDDGQSGPRPNCALVDEYHEHKTADTLEMLEAGFKGRKEPLLVIITNSGSDLSSPCGEYHEFAGKIALGDIAEGQQEAADQIFSYIAALDEDDDPLNDPSCWGKANPTLGVTITEEYLAKQVASARAMPRKQNQILRLNFCRWTDSETAWISREVWESCEQEGITWEAHAGQQAYGGLDLSYTTDLSAFAIVWPTGNDCYEAYVDFWKPKEDLQTAIDNDRQPYGLWAERGVLRLTPGKVIKLPPIGQRIAEAVDQFDLSSVAYDRYRHKELADDLADLNVIAPMMEHPQGFRRGGKLKDAKGNDVIGTDGKPMDNPLWMPNSCQETENAIIEGRLKVHKNPLLRWNAASVVVREDPAGTDNWIFDKRKSRSRIDGLVALAMAVGAAKAAAVTERPSVYGERGILTL